MATRMIKALTERGKHGVGNLSGLKVKTLAHGAKVANAPVDNFTLGELGFDDEGERIVKQLSSNDNKAVLISAVERRYLGEEMSDFYNDIGERVRVVILEEGYTRFDSSSYELDSSANGVLKAGQVAHFDTTKKKFLVSDGDAPHLDYAGASAKFLVVVNEDSQEHLCGQPMVRLEVVEA